MRSTLVYTWGFGGYGGLGHGKQQKNEYKPKLVEKLVPFEKDIKSSSCGPHCSSVLLMNGNLICCGWNRKHKLGNESVEFIHSPQMLEKPLRENREIIRASHGDMITLFLDDHGDVWGCGDNFNEYLTGRKSKDCLHNPVKIVIPEMSPRSQILKIIAGNDHYGCICSDRKLYTWGQEGGKLGHHKYENSSSILQPKLVEFFRNIRVEDVSLGGNHTLVLSGDGKVYGFGMGDYGQLGWKPEIEKGVFGSYSPVLVKYFDDNNILISKIFSGLFHSGAIDSSGNCYMWGFGSKGQIGNGSFEEKIFSPSRIAQYVDSSGKMIDLDVPNRHRFLHVECGGWHNIALLEETSDRLSNNVEKKTHVLTWGRGEEGQLGVNNEKNMNVPTVVPFFENKIVGSISAGNCINLATVEVVNKRN